MNDSERWRELVKWVMDGRQEGDFTQYLDYKELIDKIEELKK